MKRKSLPNFAGSDKLQNLDDWGFPADSTGTMTILPPPGEPRRIDPLRQDWRRFASFEYISPGTPGDPNDLAQYSQEAGEITISGAISRNYQISAKHNLRLIFRARNSLYGNDVWEFMKPLFPTSGVFQFTQLQVRNPTSDSWTQRNRLVSPTATEENRARASYLREVWARKTFRAMNPLPDPVQNNNRGLPEPTGNLIPHRRWINLFINGLYWGVYDLTERVDEDFVRTYLDPDADYDVIKSEKKTNERTAPFEPVAIDGDLVAWNNLISVCNLAKSSPNDPAALSTVSSILDLDSYFDYLLVNLYMHNSDWGGNGNNWRAFKRRGGGKFRFTIWDAEVAMGPGALETKATYFDSEKGALLPHSLLKDREDYKAAFLARMNQHFHTPGGLFSVNGPIHHSSLTFQKAIDDLRPLMNLESARWGDSSLQPGEGSPVLYRVDDDDDNNGPFGNFEDSTNWHRDTFLKDRRSDFLNQIEAALAPETP